MALDTIVNGHIERDVAIRNGKPRITGTHITVADDFLRIASQRSEHAGVAYCHKTARSIGEIIKGLILIIYEILAPEDMAGLVEYL